MRGVLKGGICSHDQAIFPSTNTVGSLVWPRVGEQLELVFNAHKQISKVSMNQHSVLNILKCYTPIATK